MSALKWVTVSVTLLFAGWACSAQDSEWATHSSCKYPKHEGWTELCLSISSPLADGPGYPVYKKGEQIDLVVSVRNEGDNVAMGVEADLDVKAVGKQTVSFGDINPGEHSQVSLSLNAIRQRTVYKRMSLKGGGVCDERSKISFPPVEVPARIGPCKEIFEEVVLDE